jgi:hypothetical protein
VVGSLLSNGVGAGSSTFTVPTTVQTASGAQSVVNGNSYEVTLQESGVPSNNAIASPSFVTVSNTQSTSCTNQGTSCTAIQGTPTVSQSGGNTIITVSYTNNSNAPLTGYVYGVVHNALGQTIAYTTATISPAAGSSTTGQLVLFGLPIGTYTVTIFVVSTSGTAISTTTSVSVTT